LPEGWTGENIAAAVAIHPNGKFGYASNRGHDSIAIFTCTADQPLKIVGRQSEGVEFSRDIAIDPTGKYLLVANQNRHDIVTFAIDQATGALKATGEVFRVPSPTCLAFVR
jgi:6-phosphogluconolactonase